MTKLLNSSKKYKWYTEFNTILSLGIRIQSFWQCCGSGSVCFGAYRIRNRKYGSGFGKTWSYCSVTSLWLFIFTNVTAPEHSFYLRGQDTESGHAASVVHLPYNRHHPQLLNTREIRNRTGTEMDTFLQPRARVINAKLTLLAKDEILGYQSAPCYLHSQLKWRITQKTMLYSDIKNPCKTENSSLFNEWPLVERKNEGRTPDKNSSLKRLQLCPETSTKNVVQEFHLRTSVTESLVRESSTQN